jgi:hypothetical protein
MSRDIPLTKGKVAIVDDEDYEWLSQWKWHCSHVYAVRRPYYGPNKKRRLIYMHRLILNTPDDMEVDHINLNGLDNRRCNIRNCTRSQNVENTSVRRDNNSGKKGVGWKKSNQKWIARINQNGKHIHIGCYDNLDEAADAYYKKSVELFGEFAYRGDRP